MTTGPPPNMIVPARYMFVKTCRANGLLRINARATSRVMKEAAGSQHADRGSRGQSSPKNPTMMMIPVLTGTTCVGSRRLFSLPFIPGSPGVKRSADGCSVASPTLALEGSVAAAIRR